MQRHSDRRCYDVLGLTPDASEDDIKRSFRRLALKLHPDKQVGSDEERATAEQRFKEVNEAYSVLSDPARRKRYDTTGKMYDDDEEDDGPVRGRSRRGGKGGGGGFDPSDVYNYISVDDLISLTFGTRRRRYSFLSEEPFLMLIIQLLPVLVLLFASVSMPPEPIASYAGTRAPFRLQPDAAYAHDRRTAHAGVTYYVGDDVAALVAHDAHARSLIEDAVESLDSLHRRTECDAQLRRKQLAVNEARRSPKGSDRDERVRSAEARSAPACDELHAMYGETRSASEAFKAGGAAKAVADPSGPGRAWRATTHGETHGGIHSAVPSTGGAAAAA